MPETTQTGRNPLARRAGSALRRRRDAALARALLTRREADEIDISPVWEDADEERRPGWRRDSIMRRTLATADIVAAGLALAIVLTFVTRSSVGFRPLDLLLAPFVVLVSKALGLYDRDQHIVRKNTIDEVPSLVSLAVFYAMVAWLGEGVLFGGYLHRPDIFALAVVGSVAFTGVRLAARTLVNGLVAPERCIVLGSEVEARRVTGKLSEAHGVQAVVVDHIPLSAGREAVRSIDQNPAHRAVPNRLGEIIAQHRAERVIIAAGNHDEEDVLHVIRLIKAMGVKVSVLPRLLEVVGSSSSFEDVDGMTVLGVRQYGASKSSLALKRFMDILGAGALLIALAPLFVLLAVAIEVDSRGPVFFRQRRIGIHGERFGMLKFRSMVPDADAIKHQLREHNEVEGGLFKIADDPRITRVGRFLRRTSLDELPQLLNVLRGDMSLVGPRPLVEDEDALIEGWKRRRLAVKPGMTGMWQIYGSSRIPMEEMVKIDYSYGANWSLWLDLKILMRTIPYMLRRRGL